MSYKIEKVTPYNETQTKQEQVIQLFNELAPQYDKLNGTLALGIDNYWRKHAMRILRKYKPQHMLDIATGTGDFAILAHQLLEPKQIIGIDISDGMMSVGKEKVEAKGLQHVISFENQDCAAMTFDDNSFDAVTISFGVRNFEQIDKSFSEILRVLKPGGIFMFIELTTPEKGPMKQLYNIYTKQVMPRIANLLKTKKPNYEYLPHSIAAFPQGREMMLILKKSGFTRIRLRRYTLGVATLYLAEKPSDDSK